VGLLVSGAASGIAGGFTQRGIETGSISQTLAPKAIALDAALGAGSAVAAKAAAVVAPKVAGAVKSALSRGRGAPAGGVRTLQAATRRSIWTATKSKSSVQNAYRHFEDHGTEVGAQNAVDYVKKAEDFLHNPPAGTLTKVRNNGDVIRYDPSTNNFGVMDAKGTPRTFFQPDPSAHGKPSNLDYFHDQ
jgi:pyocin large subunit-like protein